MLNNKRKCVIHEIRVIKANRTLLFHSNLSLFINLLTYLLQFIFVFSKEELLIRDCFILYGVGRWLVVLI